MYGGGGAGEAEVEGSGVRLTPATGGSREGMGLFDGLGRIQEEGRGLLANEIFGGSGG